MKNLDVETNERKTIPGVPPSVRPESARPPSSTASSPSEYRFFRVVQGYLDEAAALIDLPAHVRTILDQPKNELVVHFPVRRPAAWRWAASIVLLCGTAAAFAALRPQLFPRERVSPPAEEAQSEQLPAAATGGIVYWLGTMGLAEKPV